MKGRYEYAELKKILEGWKLTKEDEEYQIKTKKNRIGILNELNQEGWQAITSACQSDHFLIMREIKDRSKYNN